MTSGLIIATLAAFTVTALLAKRFIPLLMSKKLGQPIKEIGPRWHKSKEGTPVMGGLFFIVGGAVALCVSFFICEKDQLVRIWITYLAAVLFGAIGMVDDLTKLLKHSNDGLKIHQKLLLQTLVAGIYLFAMAKLGYIYTSVYIPFLHTEIELGWAFFPLAIIFVVGTDNAVNFTDGVDGLASGVTAVVCAFFAAAAIRESIPSAALISCAVFGGCVGFLVYNANPARIFMGDTGSLFLGGITVGLSFLIGSPLVIVICGIVYYVELITVALQIASFKLFGKRIFPMTPIHHSFEMAGWSEKKIDFVFCSVTLALSLVAYFFA